MKITELKGIGEKYAQLLGRLSVYTVEDLVGLYPRDYELYQEPAFISTLSPDYENNNVVIDGVVSKKIDVYHTGKLAVISTFINDENGDRIKCTWFNMPFLKSSLKLGMRYIFRGRFVIKNGIKILEQPQMYTRSQYSEIEGTMQPIYPLTKGLSNKTVANAVHQALEKFDAGLEKEYIPGYVRQKNELAEHNYAVVNIHFPKSMEDYIQARKRLAFEEFFLFVLAVRSLRNSNERIPNGYIIQNDSRTDDFIEKLPFSLTNGQKSAWTEVKKNMSGKGLMSRLIQGDVGSGKTIIAVLALMNTAYAGYQAAMMVPTEVLAKQQYDSITKMFNNMGVELNVSLLVGSMTAAAKRKVYEDIENGRTDIVIGTHAVIQEKVIFKNLALVITDEQHRFGVNQRRDLSDKGNNPHILVMSATPIPRTLAIIVYGDLDISVIDELPAERLPIKNCVVDESYRPNAYKFIENQVHAGRQAYVICPMVEDSENIEAENVIDYAKKLSGELPDDIKVEYLHGKMKASQKNEIMEKFSKNEINVLVSTTVIEVGVNVPNATVMMVENAERFGLAQLHQLRGRVGRGGFQSYCIFVSGNKSKKTKDRLEILNKTNDGFKIAEEDLKLRGPGDFFGVRQSGDFDFGIADIYTDAKVLKSASEAAGEVLDKDPELELEENRYLAEKVSEYTVKCLEKLNI
ncbi:ATP-dependent DNA helicase RecG [Lachnospira hominis (ex Hitch et al. 2024)]|uniref:ATP-dependent DNA helicase RecG n=1 Tax=Lachnospira intestinalis TaxID=3133158 RepID=A0ABV1GMZ6_9FIRM